MPRWPPRCSLFFAIFAFTWIEFVNFVPKMTTSIQSRELVLLTMIQKWIHRWCTAFWVFQFFVQNWQVLYTKFAVGIQICRCFDSKLPFWNNKICRWDLKFWNIDFRGGRANVHWQGLCESESTPILWLPWKRSIDSADFPTSPDWTKDYP